MSYMRNASLICLLTVLMGLLVPAHSSLAYSTGSSWQNTSVVYYLPVANLDSLLNNASSPPGTVSNSYYALSVAANKWGRVAQLGLYPASGPGNNTYTINTADFSSGSVCAGDDAWAVVCLTANTTYISSLYESFNTSGTYQWNTSGIMNASSLPRQADLQAVALHEFGHWFTLHDCPNNQAGAVMFFTGGYKPNLLEDDKQGAVQMYGPKTGWEDDQAEGIRDTPYYPFNNVVGYYNNQNPPPILSRRPAEVGVIPQEGSQMELMAAYSQASYSYSYFKLFTGDNNTGYCSEPNTIYPNYVTVKPGMKLQWKQYNYQQATFAPDLIMDNGVTLRDSGGKDQNNVNIHPAARYVYGTQSGGQPQNWLSFSVELCPPDPNSPTGGVGPLCGHRITQFLIAYDNGQTGSIGQFRAYFDDLRIVYP